MNTTRQYDLKSGSNIEISSSRRLDCGTETALESVSSGNIGQDVGIKSTVDSVDNAQRSLLKKNEMEIEQPSQEVSKGCLVTICALSNKQLTTICGRSLRVKHVVYMVIFALMCVIVLVVVYINFNASDRDAKQTANVERCLVDSSCKKIKLVSLPGHPLEANSFRGVENIKLDELCRQYLRIEPHGCVLTERGEELSKNDCQLTEVDCRSISSSSSSSKGIFFFP